MNFPGITKENTSGKSRKSKNLTEGGGGEFLESLQKRLHGEKLGGTLGVPRHSIPNDMMKNLDEGGLDQLINE